jgi:hypothetical protein
MDIDKLTEQILEITNNSDYGWIDLDSSDADRIRVALTKALTIPDVIKGEAEQVCETCNTKQKETIILCKECYLERAIP